MTNEKPPTQHFIDTHLNWKRLFGAAVRDSIVDYYEPRSAVIKPGFFLVRLGKGRPLVPARIWWCAHEPGNPENELEVPFLEGEAAGKPYQPALIWSSGLPTTEAEYRFRMALHAHCVEHEPDAPEANPTRKVRLRDLPSLF
jgi:hypothetical protein